MIHIIEKKFKGLVDWIHYWRNLPGKLEILQFEIERLEKRIKEKDRTYTAEIKILLGTIKQLESGNNGK